MITKLHTDWVEVDHFNHLFGGRREGLISICGDRRHPKEMAKTAAEKIDDGLPVAPYCFNCMAQLRMILSCTSTRDLRSHRTR